MGKTDFHVGMRPIMRLGSNEYAGSDRRRLKLMDKGSLPCSSRISASGKAWHLAGEEAIA